MPSDIRHPVLYKDSQTKTRSISSLIRDIMIQWSCRCNRASSFSSSFVAVGFDLAVAPDIDSVYSLDSTNEITFRDYLVRFRFIPS